MILNNHLYEYKNKIYPDILRNGNATQFIKPVAKTFCTGQGLDIGCGEWCLDGAIPVEIKNGNDAMNLPNDFYDYIYSSHCLEHLVNPVDALRHWKSRLRPEGILFLYMPHPDMEYWLPQNDERHLHAWHPKDLAKLVSDLGFANVIHSERDMAYSYCVIGFNDVC